MILGYFQVAFWLMPAEKQTRKIRKKLFAAILKQDIGWFDVYKSAELNNRLTDEFVLLFILKQSLIFTIGLKIMFKICFNSNVLCYDTMF